MRRALAMSACTRLLAATLIAVGWLGAVSAQTTPPDPAVCEGATCDELPTSVCSDAGFKISLTNYIPASTSNGGTATYVYQICSPVAGLCDGSVRNGESCFDDSFCQRKGQDEDPTARCSRECSTDTFRGLSHFDVTFPELGVESCVGEGTTVTGSCAVVGSNGSSTGGFVLGDGSCFEGGTSQSFVGKCDNTQLQPGDCIEMTLNIAGESTGVGLGATLVVDKEATTCTASCLAGPSCERCDRPPNGEACLTRTLGFWGTHPWITNDYDPVTVCGQELLCDGASDGKSNPSCGYGTCNDIMEGLGSIGGELKGNSAYVALVKQLTAAKLNLNATGALFEGATCSDFEHDGKSIQEWITTCEALCGANQATISGSGCIEALDAFNNSQDTGFDATPAPFDRPPVDDFGNISGADPSSFTAAQGNGKNAVKLVIGKGICAP